MRFTVERNDRIARGVYRMELTGDTRGITRPGQFVQVALPGFYLRRPLSVCDWSAGEQGSLTLIYKTLGQGTRLMTELEPGDSLDLLTGLGNGYDPDGLPDVQSSQRPLLVGGGVGTPPLFALCKALLALGKKPAVVLGFNTAAEIFLDADFAAMGVPVHLCTADGSAGTKGFVTQGMKALEGQYDYVFACGPEPMLKAVHGMAQAAGIPGQYSFEERMACGFGVCMGCSCETKYGSKRICKDGPVLRGEEIRW
jgi:dihydroorotate dehydrogenase electron transfer subunit